MSNSDIKIVYYDNELTDEFSTAEIKTKTVDKNFKYNGTILRPVGRALIYHALVKPSCYLYLKFWIFFYGTVNVGIYYTILLHFIFY